MNGYELHRQYWQWAFDNPEKNTLSHAGFISWLIELNNRLGWKEKFGLPTFHTMEVLNIKSYKTYKKTLDDLIEWGFVKLHQRAKNNHTSNIIELVKFTKSDTNSLTTSIINSFPSQVQVKSTIDKPQTTNQKTILFDDFWILYDKKIAKKNTHTLWDKLNHEDQAAIMAYLPEYKASTPDKQYRKDPDRFIKKRAWEDEIIKKDSRSIKMPFDEAAMEFSNALTSQL